MAEWVAKTTRISWSWKTIVFVGVAHGEDLSRKFGEAGYNFISISYKDDDDYKQQVLEEFSKRDTDIHGIMATDLLSKGFDQSDVLIGILARPFQQAIFQPRAAGGVMRTFEGKTQAIWLDHSGNDLRFRDQWDDLCAMRLASSHAWRREASEPSQLEKEKARCPRCVLSIALGHLSTLRAHAGAAIRGDSSRRNARAWRKNNANRKHSAEYKADFYAQSLGLR